MIDALQHTDGMRGDDVGACRAQIMRRQALEDLVRQAVRRGERELQRGRVGHTAAVQIRCDDAARLRQPRDLRRRAVNEDDANVQRPEQRDVEEQRREVVVRDDPGVDGQNERLVSELRDVVEDAAEVGELHGCDLRKRVPLRRRFFRQVGF